MRLDDMKEQIEYLENKINTYRTLQKHDRKEHEEQIFALVKQLEEGEERFKSLQEITTQCLKEAKEKEETLQAYLAQAEEILTDVAYQDKTSLYSRDARNYFTVKSWNK